MDMHKITFGSWLKNRRKILDLTQQALADRVNCSVETIYKIEAGQRRPSVQIAELLSAELGIRDNEREAFVQFARSTEAEQTVVRHFAYAPWRDAFIPNNNLPTQLTSLIGREQQLEQARKLLMHEDVRLLTLLGPPGIGKTRLSMGLGETVLPHFPDGVFFVELASVTSPEQVPLVIAQTLDILLRGRKDPLDSLKHYLYEQQMLLILDNFEQLLEAVDVVSTILATCPLVKFVVTSRAPLRIRGEQQFSVEALALPAQIDGMRVPELSQCSAVQLFVERAQAVLPTFKLTEENAAAVAAICTRLDELPLAIEIVAARIKILWPEEIVERLEGQRLLQSEGMVDADPRHQTLSAAIGWSYGLLNDEAQTFFRRLGSFVNGWTLAAASAVAQPEDDILEATSALVNMNLVKRQATTRDGPRFTMLQTIREYARYQLKTNGELSHMQQCHANYFYQFALEIEPKLHSGGRVAVLEGLEADHRNLLAVLDYFLSNQDWAKALRLAAALDEFWVYRNHLLIGLRYAEDLLVATQNAHLPEVRAKLLNGTAMMAYFAGDIPAMRHYAAQALATATDMKSEADIAFACVNLGMGNVFTGNFKRAIAYLEQGMESAQRVNEVWLVATVWNGFGKIADREGRSEQACLHYGNALALSDEIGYVWLSAILLHNIGMNAYNRGHHERARRFFRRSLQLSVELQDARGIAACIEKLAGLSADKGQAAQAAKLLGAADALRMLKNAPVEKLDNANYQRFLQLIREQLGDVAFNNAWNIGQQLHLSQMVSLVLDDPASSPEYDS